jgi:putative iron-dependent peroxidase
MAMPQTGIFALGDSAHIYLEFTKSAGVETATFVQTVIDIHEPRSTVGGVNIVIGFRPDLWREIDAGGLPADLRGFDAPIAGIEGFVMPATQADLFVWVAGASYDVCFDLGRDAIAKLAPVAALARELSGWSYLHSRDLTGFEDGTENPVLMIAPQIATIADGAPGAGGSILLFQQWRHRTTEWEALAVEKQEHVIGRSKAGSIELPEDVMPPDAHVPRTTVDEDGEERKIFRRNTAYGTVTEHGTVFVGFSADQLRLDRMLRRMAGAEDGIRDALTRYSTPLTGAYYFVPSLQAMAQRATPSDD